ncbi:bifunctional glycosyltransferase family 2 protein/CDP-glycerol:glycerophosphate glycerophosphotransferase [Streptomyces sp. TG1A-8]|uniref:bifunctional glycosyltransferase/CDP-glycerol:glycerophosphate glycerophosphotransferase n=1 Tax=Streptomyces sp. TG1A-8 TaxID=3051385 RepID=UPI00265C3335|nr:bifunctional glycosyltransferase family 2 protein/CDP-glycerol:glycerophosphate glycerophosphotransferase [Streptomyces sp. TG1A-8]MDO0927459.1 bifunctional glycosyltransferase family 2 protein/CDP-glycerol:glycerophosphate glycerophosphotransferase [Streptomyces sp. TG1A-8]
MPRFSVIVPAYQVQAYLSECLDSVLSQSCTDLELIAVDDCSPDACGAIIDEYAARDARVRAVHLAENGGLGRARNAGTAEATGDYLVFLDGDDTLTPDALRAIARRIEETGGPDVLVYDYARTHWDGRTVRNRIAAPLTERGPAPFRLADRPGLLRVLMVAWNKAYRREFVEREGFAFPPGYYEDTPWTFPVLMAAGSIATLDRVCVHYRQRRRGSILRTTSRRHFDVFEQYDRVFAYVERRPELHVWRPELFHRMVDHHLTVLTRRDRLPRGSRAEFLRRARTHYRRYRVPGTRTPPGSRVRHLLVRFGLHRVLGALRLASAVRRRALGSAGRAARALRTAALRLHYLVQLHLPLHADRAVFAPGGGRDHGGGPGALEEAFRAHAPHVRTAWIAGPGHRRPDPSGPRPLRPGTAACQAALARSRYLVTDTGFGPGLRKRRGQVLVQAQDGTPLRHTGLDLQEHPAAARDTDFGQLLREVDQWDYVLSGNRHSTLVWERVHPGHYTTLEYGSPRNDVFQRATAADVARLRASLGVPGDSVAVLYAPVPRDHVRTQYPPLDLERISHRLGPRFVILARAHPAPGGTPGGGARIVDVRGHPSLESLCLASDALVTDYSSLMFDYANLDRPIVVHTGDWDVYQATRGTYLDLRTFPPGAVVRSEDELIDVFATGHWQGTRAARLRAAFRERFCPYDDGHAAERVVRHVVLGETRGLPAFVPLAGRRPAPSAAAASASVPPVPAPQPSGSSPVTGSR